MKKKRVLTCALVIPTIASAGDWWSPLNDTGFTRCVDYAFDNSASHDFDLDCSLTTDGDGDPVPRGQDAHYGWDVIANDNSDGRAGFDYAKVDASGSLLPDSALTWKCVRDNVTGLMWEVKTDDGGLRDMDWVYVWYNSSSNENGGSSGVYYGGECDRPEVCNTAVFVSEVNSEGLCGHNDWRMPSVNELRSLIDYSVRSPGRKIDNNLFPHTVGGRYWTLTTAAYNVNAAWMVDFQYGAAYGGFPKSGAGSVRLVRGKIVVR